MVAMSSLASAPNIGQVLADSLDKVGIVSLDSLKRRGAIPAWRALARKNPDDASARVLYALEGACRGIRWNDIPVEERQALLAQARAEA